MSGGPAGFVTAYPVPCPPERRTFNSDGTRVDEVGLKDWDHPEKGVVGDQRYAITSFSFLLDFGEHYMIQLLLIFVAVRQRRHTMKCSRRAMRMPLRNPG